MDKGYITDIFWDRIYLNFIIELQDFEIEEIYLFLGKQIFETIKVVQISNNKYQAILNITNIRNGRMLKNGTYTVQFFDGNEYKELLIGNELGYKLENLDRIYRYKKFYAYTVNFEVKKAKYDEELTFILKSRFMEDNYIPPKVKRIKAYKSYRGRVL